jgi:phosphomannomutase
MSAPTGFGTEGLRGAAPRDFASLTPLGVDNLDGVKCSYDKAWVLFRASGMEPVVRIYPGASSWCKQLSEETRAIMEW